MATLKDIAQRVGISISTASLALRDHASISIETKQRVWEAKEALGYRAPLRIPGAISQRNRKQTGQGAGHRDIAILLVDRDFHDPRYGPMVHQITRYAAERQWRPIYVTATLEELEGGLVPSLIKGGGIDGLIVSGDYNAVAHEHLKKLGIPLVVVGRFALGDDPWMSCEPDFGHGTRLFTNRMMELGHQGFGLVIHGIYTDTYSNYLRSAFEVSLAEKGLESVGIAATETRRKGVFLTLPGLLRRRPTALLLASVFQASEAYEACHRAGLRIPEDISIVSFTSAGNCIATPSLAYMEQQTGMALRLMDKLGSLMDNADAPLTRELFPRRFVPGGSVGPSPKLN